MQHLVGILKDSRARVDAAVRAGKCGDVKERRLHSSMSDARDGLLEPVGCGCVQVYAIRMKDLSGGGSAADRLQGWVSAETGCRG
jgi:hypothetical protein